jgi:hypothetical protein
VDTDIATERLARQLERQEQLVDRLEKVLKEHRSYLKRRFRRLLGDEHAEFFTGQVARGRFRELALAEIFEGIDEVAVPVGAVDSETGYANQVDMLYVCAPLPRTDARVESSSSESSWVVRHTS